MELRIRLYGDGLITSAGDVLGTWYIILRDLFLLDSVWYHDNVITILKSDWSNLKILMSLRYRKLTSSCIECSRLPNTLHYFIQIKKNCHDNFSSITRIFSHIFSFFFTFLFTLAKFDINSFHVTIRYYNSYGNLVYLGLARIIVAQGGTGSLFFKDAG